MDETIGMKKEFHDISVGDIEVGESAPVTEDDKMLLNLGYKQEFKREFSLLAVFGQSFGSMGLCPSLVGSMAFSMNCGAGGMVWSWFVGATCLLPIAFALSELASSMPTSGSLYFWTAYLSPPKYRAFLSWFLGYVLALAYSTGFASTIYAAAGLVQATASVANPSYAPTKYEEYGIYVALSFACSALIVLPTKFLARFSSFNVVFQICTILIFIISLAASSTSETRNTGSYIFGNFENYSGWTNMGWSFILCFTTPVWVLSGFESCATIVEEAKNASKAAPIAIISSLTVSLFMGFCIMITIAGTMGHDFSSILNTPYGEPVSQVLYNNLGKRGAVGVSAVLIIALCFNCSALCLASSREIFAFARDKGLPGSWIFRKLTPGGIPLNAILLVNLYTIIVGLLMLVNVTAISSIFNLAIIAFFISYSLPLVCRLLFNRLNPGKFYCGKFSKPISIVAVAWLWFMALMLLFPSYQNPNKVEMNWAIVVLGFTVFFCVGYYYLPKYGGKTFFKGPVKTVDENVTEGVTVDFQADHVSKEDDGKSYN
ncbi:putative UGA4 GABA permease-also involved in delta-aminolevulinate transport [Schizosaccharomyces pombe]|uniref:Uncharacterized amino-acid permease PB24D3.02c n=1 Tax=Schizosaccharomyces pombe (strain 972 / ATCC 24843) TaxID=284812 RepID=YKM2_SCHPO|nr:amino-acid permease [Schizosaccharomyces pombe]Q9C0Z0.1 RecName: Full=Uncharacterized amino-acid permease PB24D3.02c [Schizosaccharomyces pombe 972h-]CAC36898.1 amino acid permease, unknown 3 (predicted) [Schizosaccharomyces pombe]|eukprot:NP_593989.1 amino-acid permease [Schizosaccharomyces pombe]